MENEKSLNDMTINELALLLIREPDRVREICSAIDDVSELYDAIIQYRLPDAAIVDDDDWQNNNDIQLALDSLSDYLGYDIDKEYEIDDEYIESIPYDEEFAQKLKNDMAYGATPTELREMCEDRGYKLDEIFDTVTLIELYESFGYTYEPDNDSLTKIERKPESKELLDWLEGREDSPTTLKRARNLEELSNAELADVLIRRPDWAEKIFSITSDIQELYNILQEKIVSPEQLSRYWQLDHNRQVRQAMQSITGHLKNDRNYQIWELVWDKYSEDSDSLSKNYQNFRATLTPYFSSGMAPEELKKMCEDAGYKLEEVYPEDTLKRAYAQFGYEYHSDSRSITRNEEIRFFIEAEEELEDFYSENPDMDDRPDSPIPEWMTPEEFGEAMSVDASINEFGEIIRPGKSPLQQKKAERDSLQETAKKYTEMEALIAKQSEKTGEQK